MRLHGVVVLYRGGINLIDLHLGFAQTLIDITPTYVSGFAHVAAGIGGRKASFEIQFRSGWLVTDAHERSRVLRFMQSVSDNDGDRLAVVKHLIVLQK